MFIKDAHGRLINTNTIDSIYEIRTPTSDKRYPIIQTWARFKQGGEPEQLEGSINDIEIQQSRIIPANPGFEVLVCWFGSEGENEKAYFDKHPVIAWRMTGYGLVPMIADNDNDNDVWNERRVIKYPDGKVVDYGSSWESENIWRADMILQSDNWRRREKAKKKRPTLI